LSQTTEMNASHPVLRVRDLHASYATATEIVRAVRGVSFELRRGERLGLVGESGSGKSALALSIAGLLEPPGRIERGEVWLRARNLTSMSEPELRQIRGKEIGIIFQDALTGLDPVKTIGSQIAESLRTHDRRISRRSARARAADLLSEVGILSASRRVDEYPHQFSGGMRQRVMIAMAIANEPQLLIADEPTTALDVTTQAQILRLLERMAATHGCAVIFITHDLGIVAGFCENVCVMYAGRIVEKTTVDHVFASPVHPYTEALLRAVPRPQLGREQPLLEIGGAPPDLAHLPQGCSFEERCFLGHGKPLCITKTPPNVQVRRGDSTISAECHVAADRVAGLTQRSIA
jgi:oligopeptide/dipeptide ABC transporter ATP-binding protein